MHKTWNMYNTSRLPYEDVQHVYHATFQYLNYFKRIYVSMKFLNSILRIKSMIMSSTWKSFIMSKMKVKKKLKDVMSRLESYNKGSKDPGH